MATKPDLAAILDGIIESSITHWSPEDIALAHKVAADFVTLHARKQLGEDVDLELAAAKAAALNIAAGQTVAGARAITEAVFRFVNAGLQLILPAPK